MNGLLTTARLRFGACSRDSPGGTAPISRGTANSVSRTTRERSRLLSSSESFPRGSSGRRAARRCRAGRGAIVQLAVFQAVNAFVEDQEPCLGIIDAPPRPSLGCRGHDSYGARLSTVCCTGPTPAAIIGIPSRLSMRFIIVDLCPGKEFAGMYAADGGPLRGHKPRRPSLSIADRPPHPSRADSRPAGALKLLSLGCRCVDPPRRPRAERSGERPTPSRRLLHSPRCGRGWHPRRNRSLRGSLGCDPPAGSGAVRTVFERDKETTRGGLADIAWTRVETRVSRVMSSAGSAVPQALTGVLRCRSWPRPQTFARLLRRTALAKAVAP